MSGPNEHFLPQGLQRNFSKRRGKSDQVWVYRRDREPFPTSTRNFGASRYFYSLAGDRAVDAAITQFENMANPYLYQLASEEAPCLDVHRISKIIAHLEVRTHNARANLGSIIDRLFHEVLAWFREPKKLGALIKSNLKTNPKILSDQMSRRGIPVALRSQVRETIEPMIEPYLDFMAPELSRDLVTIFQKQTYKMKELIKKCHLDALRADVSMPMRAANYLPLRYRIEQVRSEPVFLPDCAVVFFVDGEHRPFLAEPERLMGVFLPISPRRILIEAERAKFVDKRSTTSPCVLLL